LKIELTKRALRDLAAFDKPDRRIIAQKLEFLAQHFDELKRSKKVTELKGSHKGAYRYVVARKIRVIFALKEGKLVILVLRIGKRKDVY